MKVAILTALNVADELFKERIEKEKRLAEMEHRIDEIADAIDKEIIED
jgi:cell division protein ZapA (FtsZ GTPase activity inhibitor)